MGQHPPEQYNANDQPARLMKERTVEEEISKETEDKVSYYAYSEVEYEVDKPVISHFHAVHPHHLNELLLFL